MGERQDARIGVARVALTVFLPFAAGYFLSYLYRTVNAVIADELAASIGTSAAGLGLLTSAYFVAFAAFQLPLGVLLDRFGPRRVEASLLLVAAAGAAVFAAGERLETLAAGRALIGLGVSACLMAALKANVTWWPKERLPLVNGLFLAAGGSGAVFATTPVAALLEVTDWRGLFVGLSAVTCAAAALIWFVVPDRDDGAGGQSLGEQVRAAGRVYAHPYLWRVAPVVVLQQGTFLAYLGLWAGPWFREVEGLPRADVAWHLQCVAVAMVLGFLAIGAVAERLDRVGVAPVAVCAVTNGLSSAAGLALALGLVDAPLTLWVLVAFLGSGALLGYSVLSQAFPASLTGRVNTALNMMMFVAAFALQAGIGAVIELFPAPGGGYEALGHRVALGGLAAAQLVALLWLVRPGPRPLPAGAGPA